MDMLREHCIVGITANEARCRELVEHSIGLVTALNPYIGYKNATRIARIALESGRGVLELFEPLHPPCIPRLSLLPVHNLCLHPTRTL